MGRDGSGGWMPGQAYRIEKKKKRHACMASVGGRHRGPRSLVDSSSDLQGRQMPLGRASQWGLDHPGHGVLRGMRRTCYVTCAGTQVLPLNVHYALAAADPHLTITTPPGRGLFQRCVYQPPWARLRMQRCREQDKRRVFINYLHHATYLSRRWCVCGGGGELKRVRTYLR